MTHDPLCPSDAGKPLNIGCTYCDWVLKVRVDERAKVLEEIAQKKDWSKYD